MTIEKTTDIMQAALSSGIKAVAPILLASVMIGLSIAVMQAATQIHEQSLTFVPKLLAIGALLFAIGPWMMQTLVDFYLYIFGLILNLG